MILERQHSNNLINKIKILKKKIYSSDLINMSHTIYYSLCIKSISM